MTFKTGSKGGSIQILKIVVFLSLAQKKDFTALSSTTSMVQFLCHSFSRCPLKFPHHFPCLYMETLMLDNIHKMPLKLRILTFCFVVISKRIYCDERQYS